MDWLRRNWPDLLIGLALIAVIAGIVATLLTGGSFFPLGGPTVQPQPSQPSVSAPAPDAGAPVADDETAPEDDGPQVAVLPPAGSTDQTTPPGAPSTDVSEGEGSQEAPSEASPAEEASTEVTPLAPDEAAPGPESPEQDASLPSADAAADGVAAPSASQSTPPAPSASAPSLPSEPYRVAVGAFGQRTNAEAQAARFRTAGYPVFLGSQGDLTLVLVGPYDDEAQARRVAAEIRSGDYDVDPVIYLFEPDDAASDGASDGPSAGAANSPAAPATASSDTTGDTASDASSIPSSTPSTVASTAPSPESEGTRIQVGAYADPSAAQPQIDRLEALGFAVESVTEDGLVKLLVGPFTGEALADARVILDGAGIEYFAR